MDDVRQSMRERLAELQRELATGRERLHELERETGQVQQTVLRISGAVQVLEELLGPEAVAAAAAS